MIQELTVDLELSPSARWRLTVTQRSQARELLRMYKADLGPDPESAAFLSSTAKGLIRDEHWEEMEALAGDLELPVSDVVLCNLYYDALKTVLGHAFGCTAFA